MSNELLKKINIDKLLYLKLTLFLIFTTYLFIVYNNQYSISDILCNRNNYFILFVIFLIGVCSFIYELKKNDKISMCIMFTYLISTFFVIWYTPDKLEHYIFASVVSLCAFSFIIYHCYKNNSNNLMKCFLLAESMLIILYFTNVINFYFAEILFLLILAIFICFKHFTN